MVPRKGCLPTFREAALAPVSNMAINLVDPKTSGATHCLQRAMELAPESLARLVRGLKLVGWYQAAIEAQPGAAESDVEFQRYFRLVPGNGFERSPTHKQRLSLPRNMAFQLQPLWIA